MNFITNHENYEILFAILFFELVVLIILIFTMIALKLIEYYDSKWQPYYKQTISLILLEALEGVQSGEPLEVTLKPFANNQLLLYQVENFERRFKGGEWEVVKERICRAFLLPRARKIYHSHAWRKRNYAARAFALFPLHEDSDKVLKLVDDPVFLTRAIGASAAISLELHVAIDKIIRFMSLQEGYTYYFYKDLMINKGTFNVFEQVEEMAEKETDLSIHLACLEILSGKSMIIKRRFLTRDLYSTNEAVRLAAVKIYAHNLQKESAVVLSLCIDDTYPPIRREAAIGLSHFLSEETLVKLEKALSDPEWMVRLQAGLSLKRMGKLGLQILENQKPELNQVAYDTAQYVSHFDW